MQLLHSSSYQEIKFCSDTQTIKNIWFASTGKLSGPAFKKEVRVLAKFIKLKKPLHILGNMQDLYFALLPEMQDWVAQNLIRIVEKNAVNRYAFIIPNDFLAQLSIEQTVEGILHESKVHYGFFTAENQAENWLKRAQSHS